MKTTVRRFRLTNYELIVLIEALSANRLKRRANGIDNTATSGHNIVIQQLEIKIDL